MRLSSMPTRDRLVAQHQSQPDDHGAVAQSRAVSQNAWPAKDPDDGFPFLPPLALIHIAFAQAEQNPALPSAHKKGKVRHHTACCNPNDPLGPEPGAFSVSWFLTALVQMKHSPVILLRTGRSPALGLFADPDFDPALGQRLAQQTFDFGIGAAQIGRRRPLDRCEQRRDRDGAGKPFSAERASCLPYV